MSSGSSSSPLSTSGADPQSPPPRIPRLGWAIAFVVATTVIAWSYLQFQSAVRSRGPASPRLERYAEAPKFTLTAQDGSKVTREDLAGSVWVANFVFTRCLGPCPVMTSRMAELNQKLGPRAGDVKLVTITVDPEHDTPEVLAAYGEKVGADPDRWKFLTGPKDEVLSVVSKGFLQALGTDQEGMPVHTTRFILVDKDGWMRGFQDGNDPEVVQKLLMDIGDVLREPRREEK